MYIRRKVCIALLFAALAPAASRAQALSSSGSVVEFSASVPPVLLVSIDERQDSSMTIIGLVDPESGLFTQTAGKRFFELRSDRLCDLGFFNLFSNIPEKYKITILSQNGAMLLPSSGDRGEGVPYRLKVGGNWVAAEDGVFVFVGSGKSPRGGSAIRLELQAGVLPAEGGSDFTSIPSRSPSPWNEAPMRLRLLFIVLGLIVPLCAGAQAPAQTAAEAAVSGESLPLIAELLPPGVRPGVGLLAASTGKGDVLSLSPRLPGKEKAGAGDTSASNAAPALRIEFLALLPRLAGAAPAPGTVSAAGILSKLAFAAASPRRLSGLEYWSASRGRMRTLYSKAYRVDSMEKRSPLPDPVGIGELGGAPPWRMFVWLEDLTFGGNLYAFDISLGKRDLSLEITNLETVRYFFLPLAKPGAMRERIEVVPCVEGLLVHFTSILEAPGFGAERVFESAGNKGLAVLGWFAGRAAALGLSAPVVIPLKMEEALRPAGLP